MARFSVQRYEWTDGWVELTLPQRVEAETPKAAAERTTRSGLVECGPLSLMAAKVWGAGGAKREADVFRYWSPPGGA